MYVFGLRIIFPNKTIQTATAERKRERVGERVGERERHRERQRLGERQRQTERERQRQTDRNRDRDRDRQTYTDRDRDRETDRETETERQTERHTEIALYNYTKNAAIVFKTSPQRKYFKPLSVGIHYVNPLVSVETAASNEQPSRQEAGWMVQGEEDGRESGGGGGGVFPLHLHLSAEAAN